ncbi:MAG: hypothetical protein U9P79_09190 [Candidatus Cloacimonadota bacterium]|nr:hypothetical protein [Candidatus Cloacimonadota bacterium]
MKILKDEKGGVLLILVAIAVVVTSLVYSATMLQSARTDNVQFQYEQDQIQEEILLRSEARRTHLSVEYNQNRAIPSRTVQTSFPFRTRTYNISSTKHLESINNFMGFPTAQALAIRSLITAKTGSESSGSAAYSPVKRYTERLLRNESLAQYQYFSHWEASENADGGIEAGKVKFWGQDEFFGKVHSNDDIWVQNVGGWPTFHALVTTAGYIMDDGTNARLDEGLEDQIFLGGLQDKDDGVTEIQFEPNADLIRQNGMDPFAGSDAEIIAIKITGASFTSWLGDIELAEVKEIPVLSWYPDRHSEVMNAINAGYNWFEEEDTVWTNHISIYDTVWTPGPAMGVNNQSVWVDAELWIEGSISGKQTWGSSGNAYLTGDITYSGTTPGDEPDDPDNPNYSDYFGLVSEERIFIKYKHRDPETGEIQSPNCNGIYMYGAYAAIGEGDQSIWGVMYCHHDGIFTFEYQHPHGSTPHFESISPYSGDDTTYTYIDFHKFIFPSSFGVPANKQGFIMHGNPPPGYPMCGFPYENYSPPNNGPDYSFPYGTDYPWYNPIWPESQNSIVTERGDIHMWGAIAQRRRGFVHRSGSDPYNHPDPWEWDLEVYHYDGDHPPTGYGKDYHYDDRFMFVQPPDYPQIYHGWGEDTITAFDSKVWAFIVPPQ